METTSALDILLAIGIILGTFGTAIGTFLSARNQTKTTNTDSKKVDKLLEVEVAERSMAMSLNMAERLEDQLEECTKRKETLETRTELMIQEATELKLRLHFLVTRLRAVIDRHNKMANKDCPGFTIINDMVYQIIEEIENNVKEEQK